MGVAKWDVERFVDSLRDYIKEAVVPLARRVKAIEQGDTFLQSYQGTFAAGSECKRGTLWTHKGSLWLAKQDTTATPGTDPAAWNLVVKGRQ